MLTRPLYNLGLGLLAPLFALAGWRRCRRARRLGLELESCFASRWGHVPDGWQAGGIWVHAVSVGESRSIFPLLKALHQRHPKLPLTVTSGSVQGALQVRRFAPVPVHNTLIPYDYPFAVGRFLDRLQPALVVVVETELWPNLYHACRQATFRWSSSTRASSAAPSSATAAGVSRWWARPCAPHQPSPPSFPWMPSGW